jgi:hypothetical protein
MKSSINSLTGQLKFCAIALFQGCTLGLESSELEVLFLFILGSASIDYSIWRMAEATPFKWLAGVLVGFQVYKIAAGLEASK